MIIEMFDKHGKTVNALSDIEYDHLIKNVFLILVFYSALTSQIN